MEVAGSSETSAFTGLNGFTSHTSSSNTGLEIITYLSEKWGET
jgi:hypothetical protein